MGKAIELAYNDFEEHIDRIINLRNYFFEEIQKRISDIKINGDMRRRLPGNANISFSNIDAEELLLKLAEKGICVSSGNDASIEPSHVLLALEIPYELAKGSLRISIGKYNTKEDIDYLLENLTEIVKNLRENSKLRNPDKCRFSGKCSGNCAGCHK